MYSIIVDHHKNLPISLHTTKNIIRKITIRKISTPTVLPTTISIEIILAIELFKIFTFKMNPKTEYTKRSIKDILDKILDGILRMDWVDISWKRMSPNFIFHNQLETYINKIKKDERMHKPTIDTRKRPDLELLETDTEHEVASYEKAINENVRKRVLDFDSGESST